MTVAGGDSLVHVTNLDRRSVRLEGDHGTDPSARGEDGMMPFDCVKDNKALQGTEVYRRLDEARFK